MVDKGRLCGIAAFAFVLSVCLGCKDSEAAVRPDPNAGLTAAQRADKEVAAIQQNPNMSEKAKELAIGHIQAHGGKPTK